MHPPEPGNYNPANPPPPTQRFSLSGDPLPDLPKVGSTVDAPPPPAPQPPVSVSTPAAPKERVSLSGEPLPHQPPPAPDDRPAIKSTSPKWYPEYTEYGNVLAAAIVAVITIPLGIKAGFLATLINPAGLFAGAFAVYKGLQRIKAIDQGRADPIDRVKILGSAIVGVVAAVISLIFVIVHLVATIKNGPQ